jgi:zinc transport system permease protein
MPHQTDWASFWAARELFADAMCTACAAGAALGLLGVYVVLRRLVFLSAALAQAAGLGVVLGYYLQHLFALEAILSGDFVAQLGALVATVMVSVGVHRAQAQTAAHQDSVLGSIFLIGAAGSLVVATRIVQDLHDVQSLLLGSAVAVLPEQAHTVMLLCGALVVLHLWWQRGMSEALFDADAARVRRMPVAFLHAVFVLSLALLISVCTRVLGALPVFAFSVLPALGALGCASHMRQALWIALALGATSGVAGYAIAYLYALPVGAAQTLVAALLAMLGQAAGRLWRR